MAVKIKLQRLGKIRQPYYRVVIADARSRRSGRAIETIGKYHPKNEPSFIEIDSERAQYWLGVGAQPTEPVQHLLEITGDWQKFKGLPGAEGTLRHAQPKPDKKAVFEAAVAAAGGEPAVEATTPKKRGGAKKAEADAPKAEAAKADAPKADAAKADAPKADAPKADAPKAEAAKAETEAPAAAASDAESK
ncbi:MAG TPA: 30S ribosomal protein S16 [Pseudonocardiaceae bacterium]|nr:30S ribosomal protein S16 [Pseudonocardiaceae bacterium]